MSCSITHTHHQTYSHAGAIVLYDHAHALGAFHKRSPIEMSQFPNFAQVSKFHPTINLACCSAFTKFLCRRRSHADQGMCAGVEERLPEGAGSACWALCSTPPKTSRTHHPTSLRFSRSNRSKTLKRFMRCPGHGLWFSLAIWLCSRLFSALCQPLVALSLGHGCLSLALSLALSIWLPRSALRSEIL